MRILTVHPGASTSTKDVHDGIVGALIRQGHEVINYALDGRLAVFAHVLDHAWRRKRKTDPDITRPTIDDVLYMSGQGVLERALRFEPDWVLVISAMYLHPDILVFLKRAGLKVAVLLTESPYDDEEQTAVARAVDLVWTNERTSVPVLRRYNPHSYYLQHAYDPTRHFPISGKVEGVPEHDVVFVGTGFIERCRTLQGVNWDGIDFGLYGPWPQLGSRSKVRRFIRADEVPNSEATDLYRNAAIGLNLYRTSKGFGRHVEHVENPESLSPRALELAATGAFTLSDWRPEVEEVFGDLVPTFSTPAELEELIRYYLARPDLRAEIAEALPAAVAGMTFDTRVVQMMTDLARVGDRSQLALAS